jgi:hypothetical protein
MKKAFKIIVMTIGAFLITAGHSWAITVVYKEVELFDTQTVLNDTFTVIDAGIYMATLTDFEFPEPMSLSGMAVTTATELLGSVDAPGSFTFDATPGNYFVSFFGEAGASTSYGMYGIEISHQVPEPAAVWLFGSGLIGLIGISRRKKAA